MNVVEQGTVPRENHTRRAQRKRRKKKKKREDKNKRAAQKNLGAPEENARESRIH